MNELIQNLKQDKDTYFSTDNGILIQGNCLEKLKLIPNKSINLAVYDAPYFSTNIEEVGDKQWKSEEQYIIWCLKVIKETQRVLKDNGNFYWFHNDINIMVEILYRIKHETNLILQNQITWSKINNWKSANIKDGAGMYRSILQCYGNQRSYNGSLTEYIYYFTFNKNEYHSYIRSAIKETQKYLLSLIDIEDFTQLLLNNNICKNYNSAKQNAKNILLGKSFKPQFITKRQYNLINKNKMSYEELVNKYKKSKNISELQRYSYNQPKKSFKNKSIIDIREELKPYTTVWEYDRDNDIYKNHLTPKPLEMIKHIIEVSSNENDIVLDCFSGSGTLAVASEELNRQWICIEKEQKYCEITKDRLIHK